MSAESLVKATVAPGRTVYMGSRKTQDAHLVYPNGDPVRGLDGKPLVPVLHEGTAGPGEQVELPASEVKRLRRRGFLIDPDAVIIPAGIGPKYADTQSVDVQASARR